MFIYTSTGISHGSWVMSISAVKVKLEGDQRIKIKGQNVVHPLSNATSKLTSDSTQQQQSQSASKDIPLSFLPDEPHTINRVPSKRKRRDLKSACTSQDDRNRRFTTTEATRHDEEDTTTNLWSRNTEPTKTNFLLRESFQSSTKKTIYSLTFSEPQQQYYMPNHTGISKETQKNTSSTLTYLLATCSQRNLVLYCIGTQATETEETAVPAATFDGDSSSSETNLKEQQTESNNNNNNTRVQYCYVDTDENEDYYACTFVGRVPSVSSSNDSSQLICVGGKNARIHIIDYTSNQVTRTLSGHGGDILDLQTCPTDEWLLLSASQDYSCRLWNVRAIHDAPIAIFGGHNGHGDGVTTISWHISGTQFVSGGIDNTIKIWEISNDIRDAIISSKNLTDSVLESTNVFDQVDWIGTVVVQFPIFSTNRMHAHCVDCVEFLGDLIVSKSTENVVQLWYPIMQNKKSPLGDILQPPRSDVILLRTFQYSDGDYWFIRFAIEPKSKLLAVGTSRGTVTVWKICDDNYQSALKPIRNLYVHRPSTIRCVRFSPDGTMLFASTDDGSIFKWTLSLE